MDESTDELPLDATVTKVGITFSMPAWCVQYSENERDESKYKKYKDFAHKWNDKIKNITNKIIKMEDLRDWWEQNFKKIMEGTGFTVRTPQEGQKEATQKTGTITFVNGEKARRMKEFYQKQKGKK